MNVFLWCSRTHRNNRKCYFLIELFTFSLALNTMLMIFIVFLFYKNEKLFILCSLWGTNVVSNEKKRSKLKWHITAFETNKMTFLLYSVLYSVYDTPTPTQIEIRLNVIDISRLSFSIWNTFILNANCLIPLMNRFFFFVYMHTYKKSLDWTWKSA